MSQSPDVLSQVLIPVLLGSGQAPLALPQLPHEDASSLGE